MTRVAPSMLKPSIREWRNYSSRTPAGAWNGSSSGVKRRACPTRSCSRRWRASTRSFGRVIHRNCSRGSHASRPPGMRSGIVAAAAARPARRWRRIFRRCSPPTRARTDRRGEAAPARVVLGGARRALGAGRGLGGPGDRGAGAALVRRAGVLRRGAARGAARRAARGVDLSASAVRRCASSTGRFADFYGNVVGPYWPPERRHVEANYTTLPFPVRRTAAPAVRARAALESRAGAGLREQLVGDHALPQGAKAATRCRCCAPRSQPLWPAAGDAVEVRMPIVLRAGRLRAAG